MTGVFRCRRDLFFEMRRKRRWEVTWLPAADDRDGDEGDDEDDPRCRRARDQGQLFPQLGLEIVCGGEERKMGRSGRARADPGVQVWR